MKIILCAENFLEENCIHLFVTVFYHNANNKNIVKNLTSDNITYKNIPTSVIYYQTDRQIDR